MSDSSWHTLVDIAAATEDSQPSISARLRDFRKQKFGSHKVERVYIGGGTYLYRLLPNVKKFPYSVLA